RRAHPPSPGELGERTMHIFGPEPEPAEDDLCLGLQAIPAESFEAMLDLPVPVEQGRVGIGTGHVSGQTLEVGLEAPDLVEPRQRLRQHGERLAARDFLRQIPHADAAVEMYTPGVRFLDAGEDAAECGLARPVRADEAEALAPPDAPRAVGE